MRKKRKTYSISQLASANFMILALLWLTISAPFIQASQQALAQHISTSTDNTLPLAENDEENTSPFGNSTEEKAPSSSSSFSEEYLHDNHKTEFILDLKAQYRKCENDGTYVAFHGELLVPPPNVV